MKNYFQELNAQENDKFTQSNYPTLLKHKRFISFLNILDAFLWSVKLVKYLTASEVGPFINGNHFGLLWNFL